MAPGQIADGFCRKRIGPGLLELGIGSRDDLVGQPPASQYDLPDRFGGAAQAAAFEFSQSGTRSVPLLEDLAIPLGLSDQQQDAPGVTE